MEITYFYLEANIHKGALKCLWFQLEEFWYMSLNSVFSQTGLLFEPSIIQNEVISVAYNKPIEMN